MSVSSRIVRNSLASAGGRLWTAATMFLLMPFMYSVMGDAVGVWQLSLRIVAFFSLFDIGIAAALIKYAAEYSASGDRDRLNRAINTATVFYFLLAGIGLVVWLLLSESYLHFINTPDALLPAARGTFMWIIAVTTIIVLSSPWKYTLIGLQRLDIINLIDVGMSIPTLLATIWVLVMTHSPSQALYGMGIVQFASFSTSSAITIHYAWKLAPGYRFDLRRASWSSFRHLFDYGKKSTVVTISYLIQNQVEWLLPARFFGPGVVALYSFGAKVPEVLKNMVGPTFMAITGAASAMSVQEAPERLRLLYERGTKLSNVVVYGIGICLIVVTPIFITAWMGTGYGVSMQAMRALTLAVTAVLSTGVATAILRGTGRLRPDILGGVTLASIQVILGIVLGRVMGFHGLLLATVLAFSINALIVICATHRAFRWPVLPLFLKLYVTPFLLAILAGAPIAWLNHLYRLEIVMQGTKPRGELNLAVAGFAEALVFVTLYAAVIFVSRFVTPGDYQSMLQAIKGARTVSPIAPVQSNAPEKQAETV